MFTTRVSIATTSPRTVEHVVLSSLRRTATSTVEFRTTLHNQPTAMLPNPLMECGGSRCDILPWLACKNVRFFRQVPQSPGCRLRPVGTPSAVSHLVTAQSGTPAVARHSSSRWARISVCEVTNTYGHDTDNFKCSSRDLTSAWINQSPGLCTLSARRARALRA